MLPNLYEVLGVSLTATPDEIRQAYRARALQFHPDVRPGDPAAAEYFKLIAEAYRVLLSPELRAEYDAFLHTSAAGAPATTATTATTAPPPIAPEPPPLRLTLHPGTPAIPPLTEPTRFYLLAELAAAGEVKRMAPAPLNLAIMVDRSSSMRGPKLFEARRALRELVRQLGPDDRLTVVFFDDRPEALLDGESPVGNVGLEGAIDAVTARGSTQLGAALAFTLERLAAHIEPTRISALALITDGRTYGDEARCEELAAQARQLGVSITALGLGLDWNRELLDKVAAMSGGVCAFMANPNDLAAGLGELVTRLRETLAARMRLTLNPAQGVSVLRAAMVGPEIRESFEGPHMPGAPVTVELGAMAGSADVESGVALWETLLDPSTITPQPDGTATLGEIESSYWSPRHSGGRVIRSQATVRLPISPIAGTQPLSPEVRLALELVTAYRLQVNADRLASTGEMEEARVAMETSAIRLASAGDERLANRARGAATTLLSSPSEGLTATLQVRYDVRNHGLYHHLRRRLRARTTMPPQSR